MRITSLISSISIYICDVRKEILQSKDSASAGPDGVTNYFIRRCVDSLDKPILKMFNYSLSHGVFPEQWKNSFIQLIYKKGGKHDVTNYRPISQINTLAKIFTLFSLKNLLIFSLITLLKSSMVSSEGGPLSPIYFCILITFQRFWGTPGRWIPFT